MKNSFDTYSLKYEIYTYFINFKKTYTIGNVHVTILVDIDN